MIPVRIPLQSSCPADGAGLAGTHAGSCAVRAFPHCPRPPHDRIFALASRALKPKSKTDLAHMLSVWIGDASPRTWLDRLNGTTSTPVPAAEALVAIAKSRGISDALQIMGWAE